MTLHRLRDLRSSLLPAAITFVDCWSLLTVANCRSDTLEQLEYLETAFNLSSKRLR